MGGVSLVQCLDHRGLVAMESPISGHHSRPAVEPCSTPSSELLVPTQFDSSVPATIAT